MAKRDVPSPPLISVVAPVYHEGSIVQTFVTEVRQAIAAIQPPVAYEIVLIDGGSMVDVDSEQIRSHLHRLDLKEDIATYLACKISALTVEKGVLEFERAAFTPSETQPFSGRRNLPALEAEQTVVNYVATYNDLESRFAQFLDTAKEVLRFASLGITEQGDSRTEFKIDYLKPSGAIGFYHPEWVAVQSTATGEVNWILETRAEAGRMPQRRKQRCMIVRTGIRANWSSLAARADQSD